LNIPAGPGQSSSEKYDDFTFDAAAWTLTAHEARPGHELQFDSMVERGISIARVRYAFNSTNVEGWGLYSEYMVRPYMPLEGQLVSLDYRLLRAARAFLDPELQTAKIQPEDAKACAGAGCGAIAGIRGRGSGTVHLSRAGPGEQLLLRIQQAAGSAKGHRGGDGEKFKQKKFHDFILAQGLLPPDLMRKAVMEDFVRGSRNQVLVGSERPDPLNWYIDGFALWAVCFALPFAAWFGQAMAPRSVTSPW